MTTNTASKSLTPKKPKPYPRALNRAKAIVLFNKSGDVSLWGTQRRVSVSEPKSLSFRRGCRESGE